MKEYIERERLHEVVTDLRWSSHLNKDAALNLVDMAIDNLPAADVVERKRGKWEYIGDSYANCSVCRTIFETLPTQYVFVRNNLFCRHCGADMSEG